MFSYLREGWRSCAPRQKFSFLSAVFAVLLAVVLVSVFFTKLYTGQSAPRTDLDRALTTQIGTQSVAGVQCSRNQGTLNVRVSVDDPLFSPKPDDSLSGAEQPSPSRLYETSLYNRIFRAVRQEVLARPGCQSIETIDISCLQNQKQVAELTGNRGAEDPSGSTKQNFTTCDIQLPANGTDCSRLVMQFD